MFYVSRVNSVSSVSNNGISASLSIVSSLCTALWVFLAVLALSSSRYLFLHLSQASHHARVLSALLIGCFGTFLVRDWPVLVGGLLAPAYDLVHSGEHTDTQYLYLLVHGQDGRTGRRGDGTMGT